MTTTLLVAASTNNVIGKDNKLLWHLPNDLKFFKNTTWAMPVIMGRKTFDALAGEPLPGRFNIVITRQKDWNPHRNKLQTAATLEEGLLLARQTDCREVFIIGGGQVYALAMPLADKLLVTRVDAVLEGDAFFPAIDESQWQLVSQSDHPADEKHAYAYSFQTWKRK